MSDEDTQTVEIQVRLEVKRAAQIRATSQGHKLATVAREIVWQTSAISVPRPGSTPYPEHTSPGTKRARVRMEVPRARWGAARDRIRASGRSVAAALEDGLVHFARTGLIVPPLPTTPDTEQ